MPRKNTWRAGLAVGLALLTATAWAGYGDDRALIEDLQARYMFAFDFGDPEGYPATFAPEGVRDFFGHCEDEIARPSPSGPRSTSIP